MKKSDNCCLYAILAAAVAIIVIGLLHDYGIGEWNLLSWLGAIAIIVAVLFCAKCKRQGVSKNDRT